MLALASFIVGFVALAYEIAYFRLSTSYFGVTSYVFPILLFSYLENMALGTFLVGHLITRFKEETLFLVFTGIALLFTLPILYLQAYFLTFSYLQGELYPRVGFIVTNMSAQAPGVVHFYNGRGMAEQWIKEGKYALNWTRLSCQRFIPNQVRWALFVLAYNLGNFLRRLVLPRSIKHWSLRTLLTKLIKIGAKVVRHGRMVTFQMAEVAVSKEIWAGLLCRIDRLRWRTA